MCLPGNQRLRPCGNFLLHSSSLVGEGLLREILFVLISLAHGDSGPCNSNTALFAGDAVFTAREGGAKRYGESPGDARFGLPDGVDGVYGWEVFLKESRVGGNCSGFRCFAKKKASTSDEVNAAIEKKSTLIAWYLSPLRFWVMLVMTDGVYEANTN
jgi:hypothetical protein